MSRDASCRPAASLKFTIDHILNLKTSGTSCPPAGEHDGEGFQSYRGERRPPERPEVGTCRLSQTGELDQTLNLSFHHRFKTHSSTCFIFFKSENFIGVDEPEFMLLAVITHF